MPEIDTPRSGVTACTLFEGDFHKGGATLVNSLVEAGFRGHFWAGYRGDLPPWAKAAANVGPDHHVIVTPDGVDVHLIRLNPSSHLAQCKATFMKQIMLELQPEAKGIFFFDADIFVLAHWSFFEEWIGFGIAVCEDGALPLNPTHPIVLRWLRYAEDHGYTPVREIQTYLNSGLLGLSREHLSLLDLWDNLLAHVQKDFNTAHLMKTDTRYDLFPLMDQDVLNLACAVTPHFVSWVGPDGMGFERGSWLTLHVYMRKPWRRRVFADLLRQGEKPDMGSRLYWRFANAPLAVEPRGRVKRHRFYVPLAAFLSRFYMRAGS